MRRCLVVSERVARSERIGIAQEIAYQEGQVFSEESQTFERQAVVCCWDYGHAAEIEGWQIQESFPKGWRGCDELQQACQGNKFQSWTGVGR